MQREAEPMMFQDFGSQPTSSALQEHVFQYFILIFVQLSRVRTVPVKTGRCISLGNVFRLHFNIKYLIALKYYMCMLLYTIIEGKMRSTVNNLDQTGLYSSHLGIFYIVSFLSLPSTFLLPKYFIIKQTLKRLKTTSRV